MTYIDQKQQPRLDPASARTLVSFVAGNENATIQPGNMIVHKSRIFSGAKARALGLLDMLQTIGCDSKELEAIRVSMAGNTIGFAKEIPEYGAREEALIALVGELPRKEAEVRQGGTGILSRPQPPQQQPGGTQ